MRALPTAIAAAVFVAGCATAPAPTGDKIAVYDHRNMVTHYVYRSADSDFVGTSAKVKTSTYKVGHP